MENIKKQISGHKKEVAIVVIVLLLLIALFSTMASANDDTPEEIQVDQETGEVIEKEDDKKDDSEDSSKPASNNNGSGSYSEGKNYAKKPTEDSSTTKEVDTSVWALNVEKNNPSVNSYKDVAFGKVSVTRDGKDVSATCKISYDSSSVKNETGTYSVLISANCTEGSAARYAKVSLYIPKVDEKPQASNDTDTSSSTVTPETPVIADEKGTPSRDTNVAQEMTKIVIEWNDGTTTTYTKNQVENVYAYQVTKHFTESEIPSNYKINGNSLTVAGRTFNA